MEEPNVFMRQALFFFAGGDAGILGTLGLAVIAILSVFPLRRSRVGSIVVRGGFIISALFVACGSIAVPIWFQVVTVLWLASVLWLSSRGRLRSAGDAGFSLRGTMISTAQWIILICTCAWLVTAVALELPFHRWIKPQHRITDLLVIGDSVTAGLNDGENTWPRQLSLTAEVVVWDASQPGATLNSAVDQNVLFSDRTGLMILEIGGNDMLEGLPVQQFETNLDRLLTDVRQPGRDVVMFELPLPPFCARYGVAQRRQCQRHQVPLIPKRRFARVLSTRGATVDGIHLSVQGQTLMKALIESLLGDQLNPGSGTYHQCERTPKSESGASIDEHSRQDAETHHRSVR